MRRGPVAGAEWVRAHLGVALLGAPWQRRLRGEKYPKRHQWHRDRGVRELSSRRTAQRSTSRRVSMSRSIRKRMRQARGGQPSGCASSAAKVDMAAVISRRHPFAINSTGREPRLQGSRWSRASHDNDSRPSRGRAHAAHQVARHSRDDCRIMQDLSCLWRSSGANLLSPNTSRMLIDPERPVALMRA